MSFYRPVPAPKRRLLASLLAASVSLAMPAHAQQHSPPHKGGEWPESVRERYDEAVEALFDGKRKRYETLAESLRSYPLYPYLELAAMQHDLPQASEAEVTELIERHADSPRANALRRTWLDTLAVQKRWQDFLRHYPPNGVDRERRCQRGVALWATARHEEAMAASRDLWLSGRSQPDQCDAVFRRWKAAGHPTRDEVWARASLATRSGNLGLARYLARRLEPAQRMLLGDWGKLRSRPDKLSTLLSSKADRASLSDALSSLAIRLAWRDPDALAALWPRLEKRLLSPGRGETLRALALGFALDGNGAAEHWIAQVPDDAIDDTLAAWMAVDALRHKRWTLAVDRISRLPAGTGAKQRDSERWRYWRAHAQAAAAGDDIGEAVAAAHAALRALAKERSYYGFLAADALGQAYQFNVSNERPTDEALDAGRRSGALARALELHAIGREDDARAEWQHFLSSATQSEGVLAAHIAADAGLHAFAIVSASRAGAWDQVAVRFPTPYLETATSAADAAGIQLPWLYGIVRQESAFSPTARSGAGAIGLTQMLPRTARAVSRQANLKWRGTRSLEQPETSLALGARYLSSMLGRFDGDFAAATAAYNAGPSKVGQWRHARPLLGPALWVETVPFNETRDYIRRVAFNVVMYARIMKRPLPQMSRLLRENGFAGASKSSG